MGKGRDKQGREQKKKKKPKQPVAVVPQNVQFRHHSVVTEPTPSPKPPESF
ncbi:MAG TPA: hypothetical protein VEU76_08355 [Candidatus Udaeobacter sp.]|nr:hypothetical protein [Candidatus Udaeobacter sp.]